VVAGGGQDDDVDVRVVIEGREDLGEVGEEIMGESVSS